MATKKPSAIEAFLALSDAEKNAVFNTYAPGNHRPVGEPLDAEERAEWDAATGRRKRGRPANGEGAASVNVTIERGLLRRVDAYAKRTGLARARLVAIALENILPRDAAEPTSTSRLTPKPSKLLAPGTADIVVQRRHRRKTA